MPLMPAFCTPGWAPQTLREAWRLGSKRGASLSSRQAEPHRVCPDRLHVDITEWDAAGLVTACKPALTYRSAPLELKCGTGQRQRDRPLLFGLVIGVASAVRRGAGRTMAACWLPYQESSCRPSRSTCS